ncbi:MAG: CBS domain-containing protein [Aquificaceae bacterium]|nr:CBS domain-containing protein [Aquificaceae bacterium]MDW8423536.1 CBS domain-containing protein [Aquificaceae bacterium]
MQKLIILEEGADLDALSSAYGVLLLYEDAYLLKPAYLSRKASEVLNFFSEKFRMLETIPDSFDLVLVDAHGYEEYLQRYGKRIGEVYIYDHHPNAPRSFKGKVDMVGSCTTLLVEELIERKMPIDPESATLLALGIYEDTGMLTYEGTTHRDAEAVSWLLKMGLNLRLLRRFLSGGISKEEIDLISKHLTSLENLFLDGKRITIAVLRMEEYRPDLLSLLYEIKDIKDASAFFVIAEAGGKTYLFGRSVRGELDVSNVLQRFGGGGHEFASAVKLEGVSSERLKEILQALLRGESLPLRVEEAMSYPPFVIHEDMDISLALLELSQRNFAGAPVVNSEGKLVGVVYKKNLLKAQKHGVLAKVKDFMVDEFHTLSPEDFLWKAEEILSKYGEKLIPVVKDGNLVGVITRLDLLHAYRKHIQTLKPSEKKLDVPENIKPLLLSIGKEANSMGYRVYLVGGVVRDLLMRKKIWDLDLVVEGNAIELAKRLSQVWHVDAHTFPEFGTAHMKIGEYKVELATTRRETYPHPGSYPVVEWATLREDLLRRDFTINAMALSINSEDFGTLIDYFGGLRDLKDGILRVLHPMSFVEDPVRILRALRFAGRFGFKLSKGTEKLLKKAVELELLKKSPRGRILNELRLALREEKLLDILRLYKKYHILEQLIEGFRFSPELETLLEELRGIVSWHRIEFPQESLDYGWVFFLLLIKDVKEGEKLLKEISAPAWVRETYQLIKKDFHSLLSSLHKAQKNSEVYVLLNKKPTALLLLLMLYQKERVKLYMEKLRHVKVDAKKFEGLSGKQLGEAIEREKMKLMDSLFL